MDGGAVNDGNPLITALGVTELRVNGGEPLEVRESLRLVGVTGADDRYNRRAVIEPSTTPPRVTLIVPSVEPGEYYIYTPDWFGLTPAFDEATDIYVTADDEGVVFGGFAPPADSLASAARKILINAGAEPFEVRNFRFDDDAGDYDDPGMVQCHPRMLGPGESCRMQWDPTGQRWLVNDGLVSAELITHDLDLVTFDGDPVTYPPEA